MERAFLNTKRRKESQEGRSGNSADKWSEPEKQHFRKDERECESRREVPD